MMKRRGVVLALLLAACSSSGSSPATSATPRAPAEGTYDYVVNLPTSQIRGRLQIIGDTAIVSPQADYCRPLPDRDPLFIRYSCQSTGAFDNLLLRIDRRNPIQQSKWSANLRVQKRREVCRRSETRAGRQVCVETGIETYEDSESRSGALQVHLPPP